MIKINKILIKAIVMFLIKNINCAQILTKNNLEKPIMLICDKAFLKNEEDGKYFYERYIKKNLKNSSFEFPPVNLDEINNNNVLFFIYNKNHLISNLLVNKNKNYAYVRSFSVENNLKNKGYGYITFLNMIEYFFKKRNYLEIKLINIVRYNKDKEENYYQNNFFMEYCSDNNFMMNLTIEKFYSKEARKSFRDKINQYLQDLQKLNL